MKWCPLTRRQFLQGASSALALPLLESLLPKAVFANAMVSRQKTFVGISAHMGMFRLFGPISDYLPATNPMAGAIPGFNSFVPTGRQKIHYKDLTAIKDENGGKISTIFDEKYNPYLDKMLMLQGFDYPCLNWIHHHGQFGNQGMWDGQGMRARQMPSIDQVMAYSANFYKNPNLIGRSVSYSGQGINPVTVVKKDKDGNTLYNPDGTPQTIIENRPVWDKESSSSYTFENPLDKFNSKIITTPLVLSPTALWDKFFGNLDKPINGVKKTLVDSIIEDYRRIKNGSRLGSEDKEKLERHIAFIQDAQKEVLAVGDMCSYTRPTGSFNTQLVTDFEAMKNFYATMNSVIASIVACGLCHSFMGSAYILYAPGDSQFHAWSHSGYSSENDVISNATSYNGLIQQNKAVMDVLCFDLARKLDAVKELDNSLIACVQEHSKRGHDSWGVPIVMFGGAGNTLKTGQYIDYRNLNTGDDRATMRPGFPMNQAWATMLRAMDVPPSEFEQYNRVDQANPIFSGASGYGSTDLSQAASVVRGHYTNRWSPGMNLSDWLPLIRS